MPSGILELLWNSDSYVVFIFTFLDGSIYCGYLIPVSLESRRSLEFLAQKSLNLEEFCV